MARTKSVYRLSLNEEQIRDLEVIYRERFEQSKAWVSDLTPASDGFDRMYKMYTYYREMLDKVLKALNPDA